MASITITFLPVGRQRKKWEEANRELSPPLKALFYVSSEGELEFIYPLLTKTCRELGEKGHFVGLMHTSPSATGAAQKIKKEFSNLSLFGAPLLSSPSFLKPLIGDVKAIFMARYDFFPTLLFSFKIWAPKTSKFVLIGTPQWQEGRKGNFLKKYYYSKVLSLFTDFIPDTTLNPVFKLPPHLKNKKTSLKGHLRVQRVFERVQEKKNLKLYPTILKNLNSPPQKVILGSFWPKEASLLLTPEILSLPYEFWIFPHTLEDGEGKTQALWKKILSFLGPSVEKKIVICEVKGILAECYTYSQKVYVGGGFGKGVHSVFEPFFSGALVAHGPCEEKSSEIALIKESKFKDRIKKIESSRDFFEFLSSPPSSLVTEELAHSFQQSFNLAEKIYESVFL